MEQTHSTNNLSDDERRRRKEELRRQAQERLANAGRTTPAGTTSSQTEESVFISAAEQLEQAQESAKPSAAPYAVSSYVLPPAKASKSGPSAIALIALLLGGAAVLGAAYLYNQLEKTQAQLMAMTTVITQKTQQIDNLNMKLSNTDQTADISLDALKVVLRDQEDAITEMETRIGENTNRIKSFPNMDSLAQDQRDFVKLAYDLKVKVEVLEEKMDKLLPASGSSASLPQLRSEMTDLKKAVTDVTQTYGYKEMQDMKLQLEDINIRLDRMQNAMN